MAKLIASVMARSTEDAVRAMNASVRADAVEIRADAIWNPDLGRLRREGPLPKILTCRPVRQGGLFTGMEEDRRKLLGEAFDLGFDFVDVEMDSAEPSLIRRRETSKLILSHHDFEGIPAGVDRYFDQAAAAGADIVKLAARVDSLAGVLRLAALGGKARARGLGFVPVSLGPAGVPGRVLATRLGADFVYAAAPELPAAAPGQLDLDQMLDLYRFRSLTGQTRVWGVLGDTATNSLSPVMHNACFAAKGLDAVYVPFEEQGLAEFVEAARRLPVAGLSVTRPFKEAILPFLDEITGEARRIGAVNTVEVRDGRWLGFNSDVDGVILPIASRMDIAGACAVILGAGGAARAAAFGLRGRGAEVVILSRRPEAARRLAEAVGGRWGSMDSLHEGDRWRWDILINATPLGGFGAPVGPPLGLPEGRGRLVLDMVYQPETTPVLREARRIGATVVSGMEMLVTQAVRQFEIWFAHELGDDDRDHNRAEELRRTMAGAARVEIGRRERLGGEPADERYSRQVIFSGIGRNGQEAIGRSRVLVVGIGALGSVASEMLARAGAGEIRLVDRDYVEESNLQRQSLYQEADLGMPKAVAAADKLRRINHRVMVDGRIEDVVPGNVEALVRGATVVLDGTDNFETRFLLNDACVRSRIPWIYAAAVGSYGLSAVVLPGETPCLRCFLEEEPPPGAGPTCDTAGIVGPAVHAVAAFQVAEALKLLAGRPEDLRRSLVSLDVWSGIVEFFRRSEPRPDCPACGLGRWDYLRGGAGSRTTTLCGRNAVQVRPSATGSVALSELAERLDPLGTVTVNPFLLRFVVGQHTIVVFADGRAIIHGTDDPAEARSLYARFVG